MKRIILGTALLTILLSSCGSSTENISLTSYKGTGFTMDIPKSWTEVESKSLPTPKSGNVALALTSSDISSGFANNLLVLKDTLSDSAAKDQMTSKKYSIVNYTLTTGKYKEYTKISENNITFQDKDESVLYVFEAKYNTDTPKQRFVQTAKICDKNVYLLTIGLGSSVTNTGKYEDLAKSFTCTK